MLKKEIKESGVMTEKAEKQGMKWHIFLVRFALIAAAVWNVFIGVLHVTGLKHWVNTYFGNAIMIPEEMYLNYPLLLDIDRFFAGCLFVMAVYQVAIAVLLIKKKKCAPLHLNIMIAFMCAVSALYDFLFEVAVRNENFVRASLNYSASYITVGTATGVCVGLCLANWYYYKNRRDIVCERLFKK